MNKKEWGAVVMLVLLSNAATMFLTKKYIAPQIKTVDLVSVLEDERKNDIKSVLDGNMTKEAFVEKHNAIAEKVNTIISEQDGVVLVKQCVVGDGHEDITPVVKASISK